MQAMIGLTYVYVAAATLYSGGSHSVISSWIILIPLPAFDLLGRRSASVWMMVGLAIYGVLNYLTTHALMPYAWEDTPQTILFYWFSYVHITALVLYLPMHYKSIHAKIRYDLELHNASLEQAQVALLEEQKQKDEFISTVSHEFRTPMNAIIGFNHLLADEISQEPQSIELQLHVTQSAEHLLTVIDDILDYSQLRTGNLNIRYETFSLPQVLHNVNSLFLSKGRVKDVIFNFKSNGVPEWIVGDKHRLTQILINLVGNALKFTEKGFVELRAAPYENGILFEIEDSGIGISPEKVSLIFNQYERAHSDQATRYAGHGLGLAISKRLIELQNGTIKVNSLPGKGSLFTVWLPYRE
jgi:signal transduction histidine kinase